MNFYKTIQDFDIFKKGDIILHSSSTHFRVVKVASPSSRTIYTKLNTWDCSYKEWLRDSLILPLEIKELIKIRHHLTWRIWVNECRFLNNKGAQGFSFDVINDKKISGNKPKLLPHLMCWDCMKEGNEFMTHKPKTTKRGLCKICEQQKELCRTLYAWPVDFRNKGFGFTVISTGQNFEMNKEYYRANFTVDF